MQRAGTEEIAELVKRSADANPVIYTTAAGIEIRKSDGEVMAAIAKDADATKTRNGELETEREQERLEKRAEDELPHLPGDVKTRAAMLKAIDAIPDETHRKSALESLKAQDAGLGTAFEEHGRRGATLPAGGVNKADDELQAAIKKYAEDNKVTEAIATRDFMKTNEGRALYAKSLN